MPEATGDQSASVLPIDLRGTTTAGVRVSADIMKYFGIVAPTASTEEMQVRTRGLHSRKIYDGLTDTVKKTATVKASTWETPLQGAKGVSGTAVRIPTELKTAKGAIRFVTLRFPGKATVGDISNFIFEKFVTRKPTYFLHGGVKYAVLKKKDVGAPPEEAPTA
jgi:hypothetical protein